MRLDWNAFRELIGPDGSETKGQRFGGIPGHRDSNRILATRLPRHLIRTRV